ncbi:hypothetical protein JOD97_001412 [Duganella sp. 1411]|uniref:hypothetical protein n=1 Tax=Duganella sp. 1411 TaxID=2806572 RepID=UPI001AE4CF6E|nr:hypothetical protein [Duganella sp. 1411]MBP1203398.1 hypothetical protein [Duganella sp. 1411]
MRRMMVAGLLVVAVTAPAGAQQAPEPPMPAALEAAPAGGPTGLTDAVIRKAVRETVAEDARSGVGVSRDAGTLSAGTTQRIMTAAFEEAKVPDCLHGDALKHQPAKIGAIGVAGPYSLPWVIAAALRGKCL